MKLSVIMPVIDEAEHIVASLSYLSSLLQRDDEIIVVDGGSTDETISLAAEHARVITSARGRARQMNAGADIASGDLLLFLHVDTRLPGDARRQLATAVSSGDAWGRFDVRLSGSATAFRIIETMMNLRSRLTSVATGDQAMFVSRGLFDRVGGFDDTPLMEDIALSKKLRSSMRASCIASRAVTSSRRWQQQGVLSTVLLMWKLRLLYSLGAAPQRLAEQYYAPRSAAELLIIFARAPVAGETNTRLIPALGATAAAALQHDLVLERMRQFGSGRSYDVVLSCTPDTRHELFRYCADEYDIELRTQRGKNLGHRMQAAFRQGLRAYDKAVLIGTDAPMVDATVVEQTLAALDDHDVVIKPAEDGGYVLIAMSRFVPAVFDGVDWGSAAVMEQTVQRLRDSGCRWTALEPGWDIDTVDDYRRYLRATRPGTDAARPPRQRQGPDHR